MSHDASLRLTLLGLSCLAVAGACTTGMRKAPDYAARMHGVHKIGVMPPETTAMRIVFTGNNERIPEIADRARDVLAEDLGNEVHKYDYLVDRIVIEGPAALADPPAPADPVAPAPAAEPGGPAPAPALPAQPAAETPPAPETADASTVPETVDAPPMPETPPAPSPEELAAQAAADEELRFAATQAQKAASQALDEMYETIQMSKKEALSYERTLGPEVSRFAEMVDADALLFVRYVYLTKSGGEIAKDVAVTVLLAAATLGNMIVISGTSAARLDVCLVDGATGDVLFANTSSTGSGFSDPSLGELAKASMRGFSPRER